MSKDQKRLDEYQPAAFYKKNAKKVENGFVAFEADGVPYFAYFQGGELTLISQSYAAVSGRDNGIKSTTKNMKVEKNYRFSKMENGKHYFGIFASNGQEVATSVFFSSEAKARAAADVAMGKAKTKAKKARVANDEDNYHPLAFYSRQTTGKPANGIEKFKGDDGLHYFVYNENGKIALISEGYPAASVRDTGAASVVKNLPIEKRYHYRKLKNGKHDFKLKAGNGREIARSVWYGSAGAATVGAAYLLGTRKRSAPKPKVAAPVAAVAAASAVAATAAAKPADKDDDYLKCEEYHDRKVTDTANNVATFQHGNGQYYFVVYDKNGNVRLRSEGFPSTKKRSSELAAVLRLMGNNQYYKKIEKNGYVMDVLYDETGREVGRSCLRKIAVAAPVAAAAAPVAAAAASGGGWGWLKWLLLLIPLLLLLLGWKMCGKAEVPAITVPAVTTPTVTPPAAMAPVAMAPVAMAPAPMAAPMAAPPAMAAPTPPPPAPEPEAEVIYASGLNQCGSSNVSIFNVTRNMTPKPISLLGTNPEFGDSHDLSPRQFRTKLSERAAVSTYDKTYVDYVARSLGYDSYADIPARAFSDEVLPRGTRGLLGFSSAHAYAYSQLNTSERDRQAFRIEGVNGQVVHFMKTCGNYMYACQ